MVVYLTEPELLIEFVDGLKKAAGAAHGLGQAQLKPQWLSIRDKLEIIIMAGQELASAKSIPRYELDRIVGQMKSKADKKLEASQKTD